MKKTKIGSVGVDSGQLMISDPCYVKDFNNNEFNIKSKELDYTYSYHGACTQTCINENQGGELGNSLGVVFSSGFGDGCYDVYAYTKDIEGWGNRVCKVEIVLIDPEDIN